jgi:hypothetical protein
MHRQKGCASIATCQPGGLTPAYLSASICQHPTVDFRRALKAEGMEDMENYDNCLDLTPDNF